MLNFPSNPSVNDIYTSPTGVLYIFNGVAWDFAPQGSLNVWKYKITDYTAISNDRIIANTVTGTFTITLPGDAVNGTYVQITDGGNFYTNNLIVNPNGNTVEGFNDDVALDLAGVTYEFIFAGGTWHLTATTGAQGPASATNTGDLAFTGTTIFSNVGVSITNQGTSTGATAFLSLPADGGSNINLQNNYGSITLVSGTSPGSTHSWILQDNGKLTAAGDLIPDTNLAYDLGSTSSQWRSLYVGTSTIYIGGVPISVNLENNTLVVGVTPGTTSTTATNLATESYVIDYVAQHGGGGGSLTFVNLNNSNVIPNVTEVRISGDLDLAEVGAEGSGIVRIQNTGGAVITTSTTTQTYLELTNQTAALNLWAGPWVNFVKTDYGNEIDVISTGTLEITRGENQGIYNAATEPGWDNTYGDPDGRASPKGTLWNKDGWADLTNLDQRTYQTFYNTMGGNLGNQVLPAQFIMKDVANNTYYKIDFTVWGNSNNGAPVTYTRQQVNPTDGTNIGSLVTFTKVGYADPFISYDNVSNEVKISRGNNQSIFNIVSEQGYNNNWPGDGDGENSPAGTLWNLDGWNDLTDVKQRTYQPLIEAFDWNLGEKIVNAECVMYDTANDKYYAVKFTQWTGQSNGGGFAYKRRLINADCVFVHTENGSEVDDIAEGIGITRDSNGAIYNPYDEGSWTDQVSPGGTEWNFDGNHDLSDVENRSYTTFYAAIGYNGIGYKIEGKEAVMRLTGTNTYYTIKFLHWQQGGGGAFSYIRTPIDLAKLNEGIKFADGTIQKTSASNSVKFRGPLGRRIEEYYGYKEVKITQAQSYTLNTTMRGGNTNADYVQFNVPDLTTQQQLANGDMRNLAISVDNGATWIPLDRSSGYGQWPPGNYYNIFNTKGYVQIATYTDGQPAILKYWRGGEPQLWFDPEKSPGGDGDFRGAIIDYHAYSSDEGTIVGQIMVSRDDGDYNVTHSESISGGTGTTTVDLWRSYDSPSDYISGEGKLYAWRTNGNSDTIKIQWKATMFYGSEFWD